MTFALSPILLCKLFRLEVPNERGREGGRKYGKVITKVIYELLIGLRITHNQ